MMFKNLAITKAILELRPGSQFSVVGDSLEVDDRGFLKCVRWNDKNFDEPKALDIINHLDIINQDYTNKEYQRQRISEYPSFADQFDLLYHGGYDVWKAEIDKVKDKYPKPEST